MLAVTTLFRWCPNRRQPRMSWLATGTVVAVVLWVVFTGALAAYYGSNTTAQQVYGPLLAVLALLTWAYLTSMALHLGLAFAAQLEAAQAGVRKPEHRRVVTPPEGRSERPKRRAG